MLYSISEEEYAALIILKGAGCNVVQAAMVARDALEAGRGQIRRTRRLLQLGESELARQEKTVSFRKAAEAAMEARKHRRPRTRVDFRYLCRRLMRQCPELATRRVRSIRPEECAAWLEQAFASASQRKKARAIMSGVFTTAIRRGWCDTNPVSKVEPPTVRENPLPILTPQQIRQLENAAAQYEEGRTLAAVGLMLYAGIRPHEVARLRWQDIDTTRSAIYIQPQHSKTGGARRVTIHPPLLRILKTQQAAPHTPICPPDWPRHWRNVRRAAGWQGEHRWPQDALRHTFASYHLSHFRSYTELQCEIGHRDATLLRTRYLDLRGVANAAQFWEIENPDSRNP